jgi:hypothetical protein
MWIHINKDILKSRSIKWGYQLVVINYHEILLIVIILRNFETKKNAEADSVQTAHKTQQRPPLDVFVDSVPAYSGPSHPILVCLFVLCVRMLYLWKQSFLYMPMANSCIEPYHRCWAMVRQRQVSAMASRWAAQMHPRKRGAGRQPQVWVTSLTKRAAARFRRTQDSELTWFMGWNRPGRRPTLDVITLGINTWTLSAQDQSPS